jgi:hypothetical protein
MAVSSIRKLNDDETLVKELIVKILQIPALHGVDWDLPSPMAVAPVMDILIEAFHTRDPFLALKEEENAKALKLYPTLKQLVKESDDPLFAAVNLAILGNIVDVMISDRSNDVEKVLEEKLNNPILEKPLAELRGKLGKSRRLLYLGDNSGEIVFDKVLIETITDLYDPQIFYVVRGVPALNDVTIHEARKVGMDKVASVISNGAKRPVPGTVLSECSSELKDLLLNSDLIISKGGGNFDSIEEEKHRYKNITFMLYAKCRPYSQYFKTEMHQPILGNFFA